MNVAVSLAVICAAACVISGGKSALIGTGVNTAITITTNVNGFTKAMAVGDLFGMSVAPLGDLDGDGNADMLVGVPLDDQGGDARGSVFVLFQTAAPYTVDTTRGEGQEISELFGGFSEAGGALVNGDHFGMSVAFIGTHPITEKIVIAVGASGDNDGVANAGAVWLLELNANGTVFSAAKISATAGGFDVAGGTLSDGDRFGRSVCVVPGLSADSAVFVLAVGADGGEDGVADSGEVWLLWVLWADFSVQSVLKISNNNGGIPASTLEATGNFGFSVAAAGDVNGDGVPDILVGAPGADESVGNGGALYVLMLTAVTGAVDTFQKIDALVGGLSPSTIAAGDAFGSAVASFGDADGDGVPDCVVGAMSAESAATTDTGALHVLFLNGNGTVKGQGTRIDKGLIVPNGNLPAEMEALMYFGSGVASAGDAYNTEGVPFDLLVGAPFAHNGASGRIGNAFVLSLVGNASSSTGTTGTVGTTGAVTANGTTTGTTGAADDEEEDDSSEPPTGVVTIVIVVFSLLGAVIIFAIICWLANQQPRVDRVGRVSPSRRYRRERP
jgi:hypothetical protein